MMLSLLGRRFCLTLVDLWQWRNNWFSVSISICAPKWLRPTRRRVRNVTPFGWLTLKTSKKQLLRGLTKIKIFFIKIKYEWESRVTESNLSHSANADENKELRKNYSLENHQVLTISCFVSYVINILGTVL